MKKLKNEGGITLVALVITIVVLIILAAVTINMTVGENGLFTKAKLARDNYLIAANEEMVGLAQLEAELENANKPYYACLLKFSHDGRFRIFLVKSGETLSENDGDEDFERKTTTIDGASYIDKDGDEQTFSDYILIGEVGSYSGLFPQDLRGSDITNTQGMENIKVILKKDGNSYDITVPISLFAGEGIK